jgi:hypothetical protein
MGCSYRKAGAWLLAWLVVPSLLLGIEPSKTRKMKTGNSPVPPVAAAAEEVELFKAIDAQQLAVQFVPNNAEVAHIFVTNVSKKPLNVQLPAVFAARPVLAQFQLPGGRQPNNQTSTGQLPFGGQTPQILTGTRGTPSTTTQNPQGMFNIPPRKTIDVRVPVMCLQYGNPDPRPDIPYQLVTLESVLKKPELQAMLEEFSAGKFDQPVAQLAAWHFSNGLDLDALAATGFAPGRMAEAARVIQQVRDRVKADTTTGRTVSTKLEAAATTTTPGEAEQP